MATSPCQDGLAALCWGSGFFVLPLLAGGVSSVVGAEEQVSVLILEVSVSTAFPQRFIGPWQTQGHGLVLRRPPYSLMR